MANTRTDWFYQAHWGVMVHYLGAAPSSPGGVELTAEMWNVQIDAFDVQGLVQQLRSINTRYFLITIGQNSGHYCSPNETYDQMVGIQPSKCSRRDLIADLYEAFEPHGIRLLVYLPSGAPAADPVAVEKLKWSWGYLGEWPRAHGGPTRGERLAEFQRHWEVVIREWSLRWGNHVHGWWIDGCYFADDMYRFDDEPNFASFASALRAGNPDAMIAFNPGVRVPIICHSEYEDYTAGEISEALPTCPGRWVERNGHRAQYHLLSYLGTTWGGGDTPRFPDELVVGYTHYINRQGGVVTWEVPIQKNGLIPQPFVDQLGVLG